MQILDSLIIQEAQQIKKQIIDKNFFLLFLKNRKNYKQQRQKLLRLSNNCNQVISFLWNSSTRDDRSFH